MTRKTKMWWAFILPMLLPGMAWANNKVLSEGVCSTGCGVFIDTVNARVDLSTKSYSGGIANVGIFTSSNVVVSSDKSNRIVFYSTGSLSVNGMFNANGTDSVGILTAPTTQQSLRASMGVANENWFLQRGENVGVNGSVNMRCNNDANNSDVTCTYAGLDHRFVAGNVEIGATSAPTVPLDVNGVIRSASGGFKFPDATTQLTTAKDNSGVNNNFTGTGSNTTLGVCVSTITLTTGANPVRIWYSGGMEISAGTTGNFLTGVLIDGAFILGETAVNGLGFGNTTSGNGTTYQTPFTVQSAALTAAAHNICLTAANTANPWTICASNVQANTNKCQFGVTEVKQ